MGVISIVFMGIIMVYKPTNITMGAPPCSPNIDLDLPKVTLMFREIRSWNGHPEN